MSNEERQKLERRSFLEQCGRFAVVTPPVVSLMLTTGTKAALAASGNTTLTTTTATTTTLPTTTLPATTAPTLTLPTLSLPTLSLGMMLLPDGSEHSELAMMIDSMGVMKPS